MHTSKLAEFLNREYGISGSLDILFGYRDKNFLCHSNSNSTYVIKIMHPDTDERHVDLQCKMLQHLEHAQNLPTPRVALSVSGHSYQLTDSEPAQLCWVIDYLPGSLAADYQPHDHALLFSFGQTIAELHKQLADFDHPGLHRDFSWKLSHANWIAQHTDRLSAFSASQSTWLTTAIQRFEKEVQPALAILPGQAIHGDLNDYNVLFEQNITSGIFDFGDCHHAPRVCDLAIACTYFMMEKDNPWLALKSLVSGYHRASPFQAEEAALLFPLIAMRLAQSLVHSELAKKSDQANDYHFISEQPALRLVDQLMQLPHAFAQAWVASCCQLSALTDKLSDLQTSLLKTPPAAIVVADLTNAEVLDLSPFSLEPADPFSGQLSDPMLRDHSSPAFGAGPLSGLASGSSFELDSDSDSSFNPSKTAKMYLGRYGEPRLLYQAPAFKSGNHPTDDARTIHAGVDVFAPADTAIRAPLDGVVYAIENRRARQDYGPTVILRHKLDQHVFFTLYGHLSTSCLDKITVGSKLARGEQFCHIGAPPVNGDWPPHLHFQWILEDLECGTNIDGVCHSWAWPVWRELFANPAALLNLADSYVEYVDSGLDDLLARRRQSLGKSLSLSYAQPLHMARGWQQYLFDDQGHCYLDAYNNVPHVGHAHPRVVKAIVRQSMSLNTNSRYLHTTRIKYAERLAAKFPASLDVCFFLNSASEANELALRLARNFTQAKDMLVIADAYHGNSTTLIDISPYKAQGAGGSGCPNWVHILPAVDLYRGQYQSHQVDASAAYAEQARLKINALLKQERKLCAFICESLPSVGGQLVFPVGYLSKVYAHVRAAGGLCIADEVQTGFGRIGDHFWGFEQQQVTPDIVVLGKPIGNGHPLAAVVTRKEISDAFDNGMEFFSTFGGNTVACAAGLEVLNIVEQENLQQHIKSVGDYLKKQLQANIGAHPLVGDIRGMGLFLGVEIVTDIDLKTPGTLQANHIKNRLRQSRILIGTDGPHDNVLKIRPPAPFNRKDADRLVSKLVHIMQDTFLMSTQAVNTG